MRFMKRKRLSALFCLILLLVGCRKTPGVGAPPSGNGGTTAQELEETVLTNVYRAENFPVPDGTALNTMISPEWNGEALCFTADYYENVKDENGDKTVLHRIMLVTANRNEVLSQIPIILPDGGGLTWGCIRSGMLTAVYRNSSGTGQPEIRLFRLRITDGETRIDEELTAYLDESESILSLTVDGSGNTLLASEHRIIVLDEENGYRGTVQTDYRITRLVAGGNGGVIARAEGWEGLRILRIDTDRLEITGEIPMDADIADGAMGYDCFAVRKGGIRGVTADWKVGTAAERMTMDYAASDHTDAVGLFLCTAGEYGFLFEATEYGPKGRESSPVLYLPAPDRVLSEVTVLTARTTVTLSSAVKAAVNTFNQTHTDVRIELDDSELYEGEEAENRLAQEIVTGTAVPDILIGASDSVYIRQAVRKNLYTDLMPYIRTDGLVNESNLFGAVMRAFDDGQGGLWGLAPNFQLSPTLLSLPELLGSYADRGYWTLTEFLDFAESLPTDTELLHGLKRDSNVLLNAGGYEQFIDRESGTCSFDSPGFIRFLNFVRSLPTEEEYRRTAWGSLSEDELAEMRLKGKIALALVSPSESGQELITAFGTKDWMMIGLPAAEERAGAGIPVRMGQVFVITSSCSRPEAAWEFLRLCFTDESGQGGSPSLRSAFRNLMEEYYPMEFVNFYSLHADTGIGYWQPRDEDCPTTEKDLPYPGIVSDYTPADTAKMETVLDSAGMPLLVTWDTEIRDILFEELSAFRAGLGTAEDCAKKIQSRVSIWLAEHH